ncbi:microtubule-associated tumor suppressor 1 homolog A-like [Eublepharis macularius]|uniref:Microtubule-associated tumor suppressor 1 homolog A-like n=1 Tax=Eublepharis macularius TaxID=481883 RepID=A0AA97IYW5_EUBMA|nr:microtubule-associated tumor suppressor 1 homolog A-like [Eublepharis macularius]
MAPPELESRCSEPATAALEHLRGVEKQLQNEGLVFNKGTVQHLEDAIKAIKELEEEKKHIVDLLEEETIKNCNLRIRLKGIPQMVMEEFEALVAAAHHFRFTKIHEIELSLQEIISAVEQTCSKQRLSEERNFALCEEQKGFGSKHEETISLLNQHMAAKHGMNIQINELRNMKKDEEEETAWQVNAIEELEKKRTNEMSVFMEQHGLLESLIAELQSKLKAKKLETAKKRLDYEASLIILQAFEEEVAERNKAIVTGREELAKLFETIKRLLKELEKKKAEKQKILQKKVDLQNSVVGMDAQFNESKEALLKQLTEVKSPRVVTQTGFENMKNQKER